MIRIGILLVTLMLSSQALSQFYYTFGSKLLYSKFSYNYRTEGAYEFDEDFGSWVSSDSVDFVHDKGLNFGVSATLGYRFDLKDNYRAQGLVEGQGFLRLLRFPKDYGSYSDFSLRAGRSYLVGRTNDTRRVSGLLGIGYSSSDGFREVKFIGFNLCLGYEDTVNSGYLVGARLTGNIYVKDLYNHHQAFLSQLESRRMYSIGLSLYVGNFN